VALATPLDAVLYFGVPGFASSGSPGRALVLWALAAGALAGLGYDKLVRDEAAPVRTALAVTGCVALALGTAFVTATARAQDTLGAGTVWDAGAIRQCALLALSTASVLGLASGRARGTWMAGLPAIVVVVDLVAAGLPSVRTAPSSELYPETALVRRAREVAGHDRIAPINHGWSFEGPRAVLPPNTAMVYGLRDVQGYDSLFPGQYKRFLAEALGTDPSPPEVGNMVFVRAPDPPLLEALGVRCVIGAHPLGLTGAREEMLNGAALAEMLDASGRARTDPPGGGIEWLDDAPDRVALRVRMPAHGWLRLADQHMPGWRAAVDGRPVEIARDDGVFRRVRVAPGDHEVVFVYQPASFRTGLYASLLAIAALSAALGATAVRRRQAGGAR